MTVAGVGASCTFRDLFQDYLKELIQLGGPVDDLVALVNVYEERDALARTTAFLEWLEHDLFMCERCGHEFSGRRLEVGEDDYVLCPPCANGRRR